LSNFSLTVEEASGA